MINAYSIFESFNNPISKISPFKLSQTHTLMASSSCTTKTCYTKNHHHNCLLHLHNLHKAFKKHTLLEFAHHLHMLPVPFFSRYVLQQIHVSLNQVGTMTCSLSTLLVLNTWKHFLSIETHPFYYTLIPPYYPKSQTPWFLGPFWVQFPRLDWPKSTQKHQNHLKLWNKPSLAFHCNYVSTITPFSCNILQNDNKSNYNTIEPYDFLCFKRTHRQIIRI